VDVNVAAMERTRARRRLRPINVLLTAVLIAAVGGTYLVLRDPQEAAAAPTTATVTRGTVRATVSATGTLETAQTLRASFVASGTVSDVLVGVGDRVTKGDVIAKLTDVNDDIVRLKAPMTGTVSSVDLAVGETIGTTGATSVSVVDDSSSDTAATSGIQVTDLSELIVAASFAETDASKLKVGQHATVAFDALGTKVRATVASIDLTSSTTNNVVRYGATLALAKRPAKARPGQTATVQVVTDRAKHTLYVPSATVQSVGGQDVVTVLRNGQQSQVVVTVGIEGDQTTQILRGLSEGDQVVIPTADTDASGFPTGAFPGGGQTFVSGGGPVGGP
jgi:macrolide-specific efflux system membrane fusion protein